MPEAPYLWVLSSIFLVLVTIACFAGLVANNFKDNFPQTLGMASVGCWVSLEAYRVTLVAHYIAPLDLMLHAGLFFYALGVFIKFYYYNVKK